jgi:serine/threonine protein kinase/tetratricopeptide (TPR) repeat protein
VSTQNEKLSNKNLAIGSIVFDKYEILSFIASGGNGSVYQARDTLRNIDVAVKVLLDESNDDRRLMRFQSEAQTSSKLRHHNIATVYDFGLDGQTPFLIMEFVEGSSLEDLLAENQCLELPDFYTLFIQIAEAISHAHNNGVVHRDLKPGNIVINEEADGSKVAKILDFGVAKLIGKNGNPDVKQTPTGNIVGSPLYMSPEQARGAPITAQSDLYSLGALMYRCLTGYPPITAETSIETIMKVANTPAPPLAEQPGVNIPIELSTLVDRLLLKEPMDRPSIKEHILPTLIELSDSERESSVTVTAGDTNKPVMFKTNFTRHLVFLSLVCLVGFLAFCLYVYPEQLKKAPIVKISFEDAIFERPTNPITHRSKLKGPVINVNGGKITDQDLTNIENPLDVVEIKAGGTYLKTLSGIGRFTNLRNLEIGETDVTDKSLKQLPQLKENLRKLELTRLPVITDAGLASICQLTNLEDLDLSASTGITPSGLRKLSSLKKLKNLRLNELEDLSVADVRIFASAIEPDGVIDLARTEKISEQDFVSLGAEFPDISFVGGATQIRELQKKLVGSYSSNPSVDETIKGFQQIISVLEKAYGKGTPRARSWYLALGHAEGNERNQKSYNRRTKAYRTALELSREVNDRARELEALSSLSLTLSLAKGFEAAKEDAELAIKIADSIGQGQTSEQVTRLSMFAQAAAKDHYYADAIRYYTQARSIEEANENPRMVAVLSDYLGDAYFELKQIDKAIESYDITIRLLKDQTDKNLSERNSLAMAYAHRAHICFLENKPLAALPYSDEYFRMAMEEGIDPQLVRGSILQRIEIFKLLNRDSAEIDSLRERLSNVPK